MHAQCVSWNRGEALQLQAPAWLHAGFASDTPATDCLPLIWVSDCTHLLCPIRGPESASVLFELITWALFSGLSIEPSCSVEPGVLQIPGSQLSLRYFQLCSVRTQNPGWGAKQEHLEGKQSTNGVIISI